MKSLSLVFLVLILMTGCAGQAIKIETLEPSFYETASLSADVFRQEPRLSRYFDEAIAYAVFPGIIRAGVGFGAAYGSGWVLSDDDPPLGRVLVWQISAGPHIGGQQYRQIIFFKDARALRKFQKGTFEFAGQANLTALTSGFSATPSYNKSVAIFTLIKGGLMIEGSVGAHGYLYRPIQY
jgi:lipid-binding SYLF domain-containing protein